MATLSLRQASRQLVNQVGLGEDAFTHLYQGQLRPIFNYVRYRLGPAEAEEVTADIFARVWARRQDYDPARGTAETWLWAIARNATRDWLRRRRPALTDFPSNLAAAQDPAADVVRQEDWQQMQAALRKLRSLDQEIIALRFGAGETNRAIATMLGLSEANVAQRLRRALQRLRACLQGGDRP